MSQKQLITIIITVSVIFIILLILNLMKPMLDSIGIKNIDIKIIISLTIILIINGIMLFVRNDLETLKVITIVCFFSIIAYSLGGLGDEFLNKEINYNKMWSFAYIAFPTIVFCTYSLIKKERLSYIKDFYGDNYKDLTDNEKYYDKEKVTEIIEGIIACAIFAYIANLIYNKMGIEYTTDKTALLVFAFIVFILIAKDIIDTIRKK